MRAAAAAAAAAHEGDDNTPSGPTGRGVKIDLRLNRVENGNWLALVPLTSWRTNHNIISVKHACFNMSQVQWCPSLPYTLL